VKVAIPMVVSRESVEDRVHADEPPSQPAVIPQMLHHVTYVTYDSVATTRFYQDVMGMPLVNVVMDDHLPSTGDRTPYFHTFFRMADGSALAFFESPGLPPEPEYPVNAFKNFIHIAMEVPTRDDVDCWRTWLEANGVEVRLVDHKIIYSIYFEDPNGVRLEITATIDKSWNAQEDTAKRMMDEWGEAKAAALRSGNDVDEALRQHIARRAHQAIIHGDIDDPLAGGEPIE
jgi:catechol 2,3-dioxygenase-like lactoylglutathione lyase family enzyme